MTGTAIGAIGSTGRAQVDDHGAVSPAQVRWSLDWWIGGDDRWHHPAHEPSVRQSLVDSVPVVRTAVRVPGGDAVQHVYAVAGDVAVVEVSNESPAPFVLALVVRGAHAVGLEGGTVVVDGRPGLVSGPPSRWAAGRDADTEAVVERGHAKAGPFPPVTDRSGRLEAAFLYPVAHRTTLRAALALGSSGTRVDPSRLPGPAAAVGSWNAHLARGMQVELPDPRLGGALRRARAAALLDATAGPVDPLVVAALEDWGFDTEAAAGWSRLGWRGRRVASRRADRARRWADIASVQHEGGAPLLLATRSMLAHEDPDRSVTLLADLPPAWRGQPVTVRDAPTRAGPVSYAVRWHGPRPALLWEAPPGTRLRAPGLDPGWASDEPRGDALLTARVA